MGVRVSAAPPGVNETFWRLVLDEPLADATVVDAGTGTGRIALALASLCRRVVGIERDAALVDEARKRAAAGGIVNVDFAVADADALDDFRRIDGVTVEPDLITAHFFLSDRLVETAARTLCAGRALVLFGFHVDHWRETERRSRFAYDEERLRRLFAQHGFVVEHLAVETEVQEFRSLEEALAGAVALEDKWRADGRWFRYIRFLEDGGRTLTRSHVVAKARRS
ncbi:MAG: class I SAM-dependent methyltransferase [Candidatus Rokubacteria bacterium]|nr:class I SAM-dependent methyltransferase [Candidatus Rokubacteria bacterium]